MFAARLSSIPITTFVSGLGRQVTVRPPLHLKTQIVKSQNYATRVRPFRKIKQQLTLGERARAPAGDGGRCLKKVLLYPEIFRWEGKHTCTGTTSWIFSMEGEIYCYIIDFFNGMGYLKDGTNSR